MPLIPESETEKFCGGGKKSSGSERIKRNIIFLHIAFLNLKVKTNNNKNYSLFNMPGLQKTPTSSLWLLLQFVLELVPDEL